jgi:hypothetical protein
LLQEALAFQGKHLRHGPLPDNTAIRNLDDLGAQLKRLSNIMSH